MKYDTKPDPPLLYPFSVSLFTFRLIGLRRICAYCLQKWYLVAQLVLWSIVGVLPIQSYAQLTDDDIKEMVDQINSFANEGKFDEAESVNELFLKEYQRTGDGSYKAKYLLNLGVFELWKGDCEASAASLTNALSLLHPENDKATMATIFSNLAIVYSCLSNHATAFNHAQKALEVYTDLNNTQGIARATNSVAQLYEKLNNVDSAYALAHRGRSLSLANGLYDMVAEFDMTLGTVLLNQYQIDSSIYYLNELIGIADTVPKNRLKAIAFQYLGYAFYNMGRHHAAADAYEQAIILFRQQNWIEFTCYTELELANAYIGMGILDRAQIWLDNAGNSMKLLPDTTNGIFYTWFLVQRNLADAMGDSIAGSRYYREMLRYGDSVHSNRMENLSQVLNEGFEVKKKDEELLVLEQFARKYRIAMLLVLLAGLAIAIGLGIIIFRRKKFLKETVAEKMKIKADLTDLQNKVVASMPFVDTAELIPDQFNKVKIQEYTSGSINETDWKLLHELALNANASNKYLAEQISISHEGVRSSLKKMYRLFKIEDDVVNKKMALILKVSALSMQD